MNDRYLSRAPIWLLFAAFSLCACYSLFSTPQYLDDAFITFRMARNMADGLGPYFNPGERVQACTAPLYLLLLAGGRFLTGLSVPQFESFVEFAALTSLFLMLWRFGRDLNFSASWALLLPLLLAMQPDQLIQVKGMEAIFFSALILGFCLAERRNMPIVVGILMGLAACTRTEGGIIGVAYLLYFGIGLLFYGKAEYKLKNLAVSAMAAVLTGLPVLASIILHYDSLLPNSVRAKALQSALGWRSVRWDWREYLVGQPPWISVWGILLVLATILLTAESVAAIRRRISKSGLTGDARATPETSPALFRSLGPLCIFGLLHGGLFVVARAPQGYHWYLFPEKVLLIPLFALGIAGLWRISGGEDPLPSVEGTGGDPPRVRSRAARIAALAFLVLIALGLLAQRCAAVSGVLAEVRSGRNHFANDKSYPWIGKRLAERAPKDWAFGAAEVGMLGYYSGLKCDDLAGIVTPQSLPYFTKEPLSQLLFRYRPEIYVTDYFEELKPSSPLYNADAARRLDEDYALLGSFPNLSGETRVYCRKDARSQLRWD